MPEKALKTFQNILLYSKKAVVLENNNSRRENNNNGQNKRNDSNIANKINKFVSIIKNRRVYRIPLRYPVDLGLVNFHEKFSTRFILTLEQDMNRLFESNAKVNLVPQQDAKIIIYEAPSISYLQIKLDKNFEFYFNSNLRAKKALRTGIRMTPH